MNRRISTRIIGRWGEHKARWYLSAHGLRFCTRNFRCRYGEIDLIMTDAMHTIFVEVRSQYCGSMEQVQQTVDWNKQQRLIRTAACYLQNYDCMAQRGCRFDVIAICWRRNYLSHDLTWVKAAFDASAAQQCVL